MHFFQSRRTSHRYERFDPGTVGLATVLLAIAAFLLIVTANIFVMSVIAN